LRKFNFPTWLLALVLVFGIVLPAPAEEKHSLGPETFIEILEYTRTLHISNPDYDILLRGAIEGLIDSLCDPYTEYLSPSELDDFSGSLDGNYVGVGMLLQAGEKYPEVIETIAGTPARNAGVKPGDRVTRVDGSDVAGEPLVMVVQRIRGPEGTKVNLTLRREGRADFDIELERAGIDTPTVNGELLTGNIGYIRISSFGNQTAGEFKKTLAGLVNREAQKIILDLRDNPGGILQTAVQICGSFVEQGRVVVSILDSDGERQEYRTEDVPTCKGMPVAVLVNHNSASAAEILAGALQDYGAAVVIGEQTYGKGTVQVMVPLESGGALKVTTARYHTPKDRVIDGTGLDPDIRVLTPGLQIAAAQCYLEQPEKIKIILKTDRDEVYVNGVPVRTRQPVLQRQGAVFLPVRLVFEALGCRVDWQADCRAISITGNNTAIIINTGSGNITVNGWNPAVKSSVWFEGGSAFIPASVLNYLDLNVNVDGNNITIEK